MNSASFNYELVKRSIAMSLDRSGRERELISKLLSSLYPKLLTSDDVDKGFERLLEIVDELQVDVPR